MTLKLIGVGARLIGAHPSALLPMGLQRFHHLNMLGRVHGTKTSEHMRRLLRKMNAIVFKTCGSILILVSTENSILFRDPDHAFNGFERFNARLIQFMGITQ